MSHLILSHLTLPARRPHLALGLPRLPLVFLVPARARPPQVLASAPRGPGWSQEKAQCLPLLDRLLQSLFPLLGRYSFNDLSSPSHHVVFYGLSSLWFPLVPGPFASASYIRLMHPNCMLPCCMAHSAPWLLRKLATSFEKQKQFYPELWHP